MDDRTAYDWGQMAQVGPSIKRADVRAWLVSSVFLGSLAAFAILSALWRPLPLLGTPPWMLRDHASCALKVAARQAIGTFKFEARVCENSYVSLDADQIDALRLRLAIAAIVFFLPGALLAGPAMRGRDGLTHLRGSTRTRGIEAKNAINLALAKRVKRRPDHEIAPGVPYPGDMWTRHVLVVGGVGSGKSTAIKPLIQKIVDAGEQMLLFDPKSEFTMGFAKPRILAPWDARSLSWDIAKDMRNPLDMRRFAASMIKESQDPMWSNASRQLLVGLMIYLKRTRGADWGWQELSDLIALPQDGLLSIMKRFHPEAIRAVEKASVTTAGILINLASFCSTIFDLAQSWGEKPKEKRISFVEWTQGKSPFKQVILQGHGAYADLTKSYVEAVIGVVSAMVNSVEMIDDPKRKIWIVADEFGAMGKVPGIRPLFEVGRSRGVRCVVACQDFAQLEEIYGQPMVKALVGMCGTLLVGQVMQGETAESLCKAFGAREVERANYSSSFGGAGNGPGRSTTLSFNRDEVPLYKPSELTSRLGLNREGTAVTLLLFTGGQAYELEWPLFDIKNARMPHVPARWTLGCGPEVDDPSVAQGASQSLKAIESQSQPDQAQRGMDAVVTPTTNVAVAVSDPLAASAASADATSSGLVDSSRVGAEKRSAADESKSLPHLQANHPSWMDSPRRGGGVTQGVAAHGRSGHRGGAQPEQEPESVPKQEIEVVAAHGVSVPIAHPSGCESEPAFDAMAELAAIKLGAPLLGLAVEAVAVSEAVAAPRDAPQQTVRLVAAARIRPDR